MTRRRPDLEHLPPPLQRLGTQLVDLERAEERARAAGTRRRRPISISVGGALAGVLVVLIATLDTGGGAHASILNRAPAAADAAESVRFRSTISIEVGSRQVTSFTQLGQVDFAHRAYATILHVGRSGLTIEQRRVGAFFFVAQTNRVARGSVPTRWIGIPVAREASNTFAGPDSAEFTNPLALLDELASTRAPVNSLGNSRLDGVATTRYALRTKLAALLGASPNVGHLPAFFDKALVTLIVWLDHQARPQRTEEIVSGTSARGTARIKTVIDFSDYAQPVRIFEPRNVAFRARRSIVATNPLAASPSRLYERMLLAAGAARSCAGVSDDCRRIPHP